MNLFDIVPENLFSILSSPNKKIYINALFVIRECFSQEMSIPKESVAIAIASKMEDELLQIQVEDEEERIENSLSERAYAYQTYATLKVAVEEENNRLYDATRISI